MLVLAEHEMADMSIHGTAAGKRIVYRDRQRNATQRNASHTIPFQKELHNIYLHLHIHMQRPYRRYLTRLTT